ncbi:MAG: helix-turn-helix transcriptional regulator [Hyphomicrobiales bacterium]|nr:helix-turn-helix transcriptional regulator [Hyphomicrobiales bacterium]
MENTDKPILTHAQIWAAVDALAARYGLTASGLARHAGLDPTTFNPSKRVTAHGRDRWPSTESLAKVLNATGASLHELATLTETGSNGETSARPIPLIEFAQAGTGGFFDAGGCPIGTAWEQIHFPEVDDETAYALEVAGDAMLPLYREGDIIVVSPAAGVRRGDRVVVRLSDGEVMARILARRTAKTVELGPLNPEHAALILPVDRIGWMARIVWASQ